MADRILFQKDWLSVTEAKITVGKVTVFLPNVSVIFWLTAQPLDTFIPAIAPGPAAVR